MFSIVVKFKLFTIVTVSSYISIAAGAAFHIAPCKESLLQGFDKRLSLGSLKDLRNILSLGSLRDLRKMHTECSRYQVSGITNSEIVMVDRDFIVDRPCINRAEKAINHVLLLIGFLGQWLIAGLIWGRQDQSWDDFGPTISRI